jgi:ferritin-like protein
MANETLHEAAEALSWKTRDLHRSLASLREELDAIDAYRQRANACHDPQLREILQHHMEEEMEHAAMLIEWLRRNDSRFDRRLREYVFTEAPLVAAQAAAGRHPPATADKASTIGAMKEET